MARSATSFASVLYVTPMCGAASNMLTRLRGGGRFFLVTISSYFLCVQGISRSTVTHGWVMIRNDTLSILLTLDRIKANSPIPLCNSMWCNIMSGREQFTNNGGIATRHGPVVFHLEHLDRGDHWSTVRK